jgi:hypothetical protein
MIGIFSFDARQRPDRQRIPQSKLVNISENIKE